MRSKLISVSPFEIRYKLLASTLISTDGSRPKDWDLHRVDLTETAKYQSVMQRFGEGRRWEDTALFTKQYPLRFGLGDRVRNCRNLQELAAVYYDRYDPLFEHMRDNGYVTRVKGQPVQIPPAYLCRDGELAIGNNGNHRLPMARLLALESVVVELRARHPLAPERRFIPVESNAVALHAEAHSIPAMTTLDERLAYYDLAKEAAPRGAVVELGTWLGAATVYIAAGIRDAGGGALHAYDKFSWQKMHEVKAGGPLEVPMVEQFEKNLGPLRKFVTIHEGEITKQSWDGEIAYLACDAPKKMEQLIFVLRTFGSHLIEKGALSIQDFAYFPAYELVAVMEIMEQAGRVEFVRSVYPGTTAIWKVARNWSAGDITEDEIALRSWKPTRILNTWAKWADRIEKDGRPRFMCGAALFLHERGYTAEAVDLFKGLAKDKSVMAKFAYLKKYRPTFVTRFKHLFDVYA